MKSVGGIRRGRQPSSPTKSQRLVCDTEVRTRFWMVDCFFLFKETNPLHINQWRSSKETAPGRPALDVNRKRSEQHEHEKKFTIKRKHVFQWTFFLKRPALITNHKFLCTIKDGAVKTLQHVFHPSAVRLADVFLLSTSTRQQSNRYCAECIISCPDSFPDVAIRVEWK